jgi:hypothetical protein
MSTYGFGLYGGAGGTYAEPWSGTLLPTDIAAIAQAVFDLGANVVSVNGYDVQGEGTEANPWNPI